MELQEKVALYLKAKQAYYFDSPIMSDAQFDKLEEEIRTADPNEPALKIVGAPVPKGTPHAKAEHLIHMGSQEKVNLFSELDRWQKLRANDPSQKFHGSFKADGGSIALYYRKGKLFKVITRGDGFLGEDISAQAALFKGVRLTLDEPLDIGVRCEAVVTLEDWPKADPEKKTNPRNVATGILGRLDVLKADYVTVLAFDIDPLPNHSPETEALFADVHTETARSRLLKLLGFQTTPWKGNLSLAEMEAFYEETKQTRLKDELPFWIDGMIVRYEDVELQKELGSSDNRPKGQVAWKFPAESAWTPLKSVEAQVGHTGAITPVGWIEPVRLGGTTITKASLANYDNIKTLGVKIGSLVEVVKAGDIIPMIISAKGGDTEIPIPTECPVCQTALEKRKNVDGSDSVVLFCPNTECEARTLGRIKRFCKSRDILGLGDSVIAALVENNLIASVRDLYRLKIEDLEDLVINTEKGVRLGKKRAEGILSEIQEKATKMTLVEFLGSFGTRSLGVRRAELMLAANPALSTIDAWLGGSLLKDEFAAAAGVPKAGAIIYDGLKEYETVIRETLEFVTIVEPKAKPTTPTGGKTICITGSLPSGKKKKEYAGPLAEAGHQLVDEISKDVNILVMADPNGPPSAKTKKAQKLGITLMDEAGLVALIEAGKPASNENNAPPKPSDTPKEPEDKPTGEPKKFDVLTEFVAEAQNPQPKKKPSLEDLQGELF